MPERHLVLIISLEKETHPRLARLNEALLANGFVGEIVEGVRGRDLSAGEYFDLIQPYRLARGHSLTPAELGCAIGHRRAIQRFLEIGANRVVIFEDDVLFDDIGLRRLTELMRSAICNDGLLLLGGQEDLEHLINSAHGRLVDSANEVWEIFSGDLKLVHRAVGYSVTLPLAERLEQLASKGAFLADDFGYMVEQGGVSRVYIANCVGHPRDLSHSAIEREREMNRAGRDTMSNPLLTRLAYELRASVHGRRMERDQRHARTGYQRIRWASRF